MRLHPMARHGEEPPRLNAALPQPVNEPRCVGDLDGHEQSRREVVFLHPLHTDAWNLRELLGVVVAMNRHGTRRWILSATSRTRKLPPLTLNACACTEAGSAASTRR